MANSNTTSRMQRLHSKGFAILSAEDCPMPLEDLSFTLEGMTYAHDTVVDAPEIEAFELKRITRTLGTLIASGVPILETLNIVAGTASSIRAKQLLTLMFDSVRTGDTLAEVVNLKFRHQHPDRAVGEFVETYVFPELADSRLFTMIEVGEETGDLDTMLYQLSEMYADLDEGQYYNDICETPAVFAMTKELSQLLRAGLPVLRSLKSCAKSTRSPRLRKALAKVIDQVESGASLSEALARQPLYFNRLYVNMVRAGEAGGALDIILQRMVD